MVIDFAENTPAGHARVYRRLAGAAISGSNF